MPDSTIIALSTCPNEESARVLAEALVTERVAACVNRVTGVRSTYFWDGRLQDDAEVLLIIKSDAERLPDLKERLKALHPYEVPELVVLPIVGGNEAYLDWVGKSVTKGTNA